MDSSSLAPQLLEAGNGVWNVRATDVYPMSIAESISLGRREGGRDGERGGGKEGGREGGSEGGKEGGREGVLGWH